MKKLMIITLAAVMTLAFAACSRGGGSSSGNADLSDSRYVGTWRAGELTLGGEADELKGGEWTITLNGDGTGGVYDSGNYIMRVYDAAGNMTEYTYTILMYFNASSLAFFALVLAVVAAVIVYIVTKRRKLKIG